MCFFGLICWDKVLFNKGILEVIWWFVGFVGLGSGCFGGAESIVSSYKRRDIKPRIAFLLTSNYPP